MKERLDALVVVEGITDVQFLSTFLEAEFVTTNGSDVPQATLDYLKAQHQKNKRIIVLTDPDSPGKRIRDVLDQHIPHLEHVYVEKNKAIKKNKVGIAQTNKETILEAIKHRIIHSKQPLTTVKQLTQIELMQLGLIGSHGALETRNFLSKKLHLGFVNAKTLLKRLNALSLDLDTIKETLKHYEKT
jgi:ribonuclease M5